MEAPLLSPETHSWGRAFVSQVSPEYHAHKEPSAGIVPSGHHTLNQRLLEIGFIFGDQMDHAGKSFVRVAALAKPGNR